MRLSRFHKHLIIIKVLYRTGNKHGVGVGMVFYMKNFPFYSLNADDGKNKNFLIQTAAIRMMENIKRSQIWLRMNGRIDKGHPWVYYAKNNF